MIIQKYKICVDILNVSFKYSPKLIQIGSGAYGNVYKINLSNNNSITSKRINFEKNIVFK